MKDSSKPKENAPQYFNRELSWLAFDRRVLNLCSRQEFPILEKLRFLSIVSNNLDEFFEIRVAGLQQQLESGVLEVGFDGLGPREQLRRISAVTNALIADEYRCWTEELKPALAKEKLFFKVPRECSQQQKAWLEDYFQKNIYPALTPMAIDPAHPFPHIRNKGLYVLVTIANPQVRRAPGELAIIPVPPILSRIIRIESNDQAGEHFVFLSDVVKHFAETLFTGYKVRNAAVFRITRNSDLYFDEEETENLLLTIENELHNRRKGAAVRLEIEDNVGEMPLRVLAEAMDIDDNYIFRIGASPMNLARLSQAYDIIDRPDLKFPPFRPYTPPEFHNCEDIFAVIRESDRLLHHPYDSFTPVEDFIDRAANDANVVAIKLTLYRTNKNSRIIDSLKKAAEAGKQVTALIELKARFDEENNIQWARELEEDGAHVVYGMVGYKTHCKTCLVVRRDSDGVMRRYAHLGTGNYNSKTARIYTDLSFFTANEELTQEVANLFNALTGKIASPDFKKLIVAPFNLHSKFIELVKRETEHAKAKRPARIVLKVNALIEQSSIDALYEASCAGVKIDLLVRGICGLVPGVKGMSKNITVRSIVGVYLEHSRIYYFENGGNPEVYAGSADIMSRNMFKRIECVFPIENPALKARVTDEILMSMLEDNQYANLLHPNGAYFKPPEMKKLPKFSCQQRFMDLSCERNAALQSVKKSKKS
ncbi:MAG: polyphosphate kinase 1 [Verrucomicrobia bacterium]|nr:MAG: polyphosphate kinase 1 [Verrucomicrobiota bacterium]